MKKIAAIVAACSLFLPGCGAGGGAAPQSFAPSVIPESLPALDQLAKAGSLSDESSTRYIYALQGRTVFVYPLGSTLLTLAIPLPQYPYSNVVAVDPSGNVYVNELTSLHPRVTEYGAGTQTIVRSITKGIRDPDAFLVDSSGDLYIADTVEDHVVMYAPGATTPTRTYTEGLFAPVAVVLGPDGDLYVPSEAGTITVFAAGSVNRKYTISAPSLSSGEQSYAIDSSGTFYAAAGTTINVYDSGSRTVSRTITAPGPNTFGALAVDKMRNLYAANNGNGGPSVLVYAPGTSTPVSTITAGICNPAYLAIGPAGNLYVSNGCSDITEYLPGSTTVNRTYPVSHTNGIAVTGQL